MKSKMFGFLTATGKTFDCCRLLSLSIGLVYLWFGALKFFPGMSPAEGLATETISQLTFGLLAPSYEMILLALWETSVGVFLIINILPRITLPLALVHILLTFTPLVFFPEKVFAGSPFYLTLIGQYIAKNIIIAGVLFVLWKQARVGGKSAPDHLLSQRVLS